MKSDSFLLKLHCPDAVGLLALITGFVARRGLNLLEVHQFTDPEERWFFCRLEIENPGTGETLDPFREAFATLVEPLQATWSVRRGERRMRTAFLVSREDHCLADMLWRWRSGEISLDVVGVFSNHQTLRPVAEKEGLPFLYLPVGVDDSHGQPQALAAALQEAGAELVVLARYMQILPDWFCREFAGRIINIHHSFLPAFAGANPYRQAYARGVKLIGATCHYATAELDAGPIIDQEVVRVEHYHGVADLRRAGRDCEKLALSRGVRYHVEDRVLLRGHRTVVFRD